MFGVNLFDSGSHKTQNVFFLSVAATHLGFSCCQPFIHTLVSFHYQFRILRHLRLRAQTCPDPQPSERRHECTLFSVCVCVDVCEHVCLLVYAVHKTN